MNDLETIDVSLALPRTTHAAIQRIADVAVVPFDHAVAVILASAVISMEKPQAAAEQPATPSP